MRSELTSSYSFHPRVRCDVGQFITGTNHVPVRHLILQLAMAYFLLPDDRRTWRRRTSSRSSALLPAQIHSALLASNAIRLESQASAAAHGGEQTPEGEA